MSKKRALISVSDKSGLIEFARFLEENNYELVSTGGTFKHLKDAGLSPIQIDEVTDFPEMLDGRVKTLHPKVHGGLLAVRDNEEHMSTVQQHEIGLIDMVIVNLYPFFENANSDISLDEKVEDRISAFQEHYDVVCTDNTSYYELGKRISEHLNRATDKEER